VAGRLTRIIKFSPSSDKKKRKKQKQKLNKEKLYFQVNKIQSGGNT
jgi:hypothetical protein